MVKTPRTRHSKTSKEPVTIDLAPGEISRAKAEAEKADPVKQSEAPQQAKAETPKPEDSKPANQSSAASGADTRDAKPQPAAASSQQKPGAAATGSSQTFGRKEKDTAAPAAPPSSGRSSALAAGVAGGVIALVLAGGLQLAGLLPAPGSSGEQPADPTASIDALEQEIAALRSEIGGATGSGTELGGRVSQAEERVTALASQIETLTGEVAGIAREPGGEAAAPVDLSPLEERLAILEGTVGALGDAGPSQAVKERLTALGDEIAAAREAQAAAGTRLDAVEKSIGDLSGRVDEAAETPATAVIIAASALKAAIERGVPFTAELDTLAALAPEAPQIGDLRELAADGVPTRAQIAEESDAAANAMIAAARPVDPQAGVIDRLMGSAMSLVQVRPVGMVEGDGVPEIVARLDAAVQAGDYERALAEYDALPEPSKAAGAAFIEKVRARQNADRLIDDALAAALAK
ncbi:COG4223 family protein [Neoaquamicrobium sediminum]|uniref:Phage tail protein n=1 Tax=Neoaquamicrobium sediminum TaxID=1849104 RepID=A0ABV3WM31_9HYPH